MPEEFGFFFFLNIQKEIFSAKAADMFSKNDCLYHDDLSICIQKKSDNTSLLFSIHAIYYARFVIRRILYLIEKYFVNVKNIEKTIVKTIIHIL